MNDYEDMKRLLEEVFNELASVYCPKNEDDVLWWDDIIERVRKCGINV